MRLGQAKLIFCFTDFFPCKPDQAGQLITKFLTSTFDGLLPSYEGPLVTPASMYLLLPWGA